MHTRERTHTASARWAGPCVSGVQERKRFRGGVCFRGISEALSVSVGTGPGAPGLSLCASAGLPACASLGEAWPSRGCRVAGGHCQRAFSRHAARQVAIPCTVPSAATLFQQALRDYLESGPLSPVCDVTGQLFLTFRSSNPSPLQAIGRASRRPDRDL